MPNSNRPLKAHGSIHQTQKVCRPINRSNTPRHALYEGGVDDADVGLLLCDPRKLFGKKYPYYESCTLVHCRNFFLSPRTALASKE